MCFHLHRASKRESLPGQQLNLSMTFPNADDEDCDADQLNFESRVHVTQIPSSEQFESSVLSSNSLLSSGSDDAAEHDEIYQYFKSRERSMSRNDMTGISCTDVSSDMHTQSSGRDNDDSTVLDSAASSKAPSLKKPRPHSAKAVLSHDHTNDIIDENIELVHSRRPRPWSGSRSLRHVKSRTDSGISQPAKKYRHAHGNVKTCCLSLPLCVCIR